MFSLFSIVFKLKGNISSQHLIEKKQNVSKYQLSKTQVDSILDLKIQKLTSFGISEI